jgi:RNA recognition motif-containing protein
MAKKIYVGNMSYSTTDASLRELFSQYGEVVSATVITDRATGQAKGFGFVEMGSDEEASSAINGTNGLDFEGRKLRVNEALDKPRTGGNGGRFRE